MRLVAVVLGDRLRRGVMTGPVEGTHAGAELRTSRPPHPHAPTMRASMSCSRAVMPAAVRSSTVR